MKTIFALLCVLCALCGSTLAEVNSTVDSVSYNGNGSTATFTVPFGIFSTSTLRVVLRTTATGAEDVQVLNSDFTATDNDSDGDWWDGTPGGSITFTAAPASGVEVWISRVPPLTQTSDIDGSTYVRLSTIEDAVDKIVTQIQYLRGLSWRALMAQETDREVVDMSLPDGWSLSAGYPYWDGDSWGMSSTDLADTAASAFWGNVLTETTLSGSLTAMGGASAIRPLLAVGVINVTDAPYNATGDGVTDDTAAIQAAIDAAIAAGGGTVFFPPGTYLAEVTMATTPYLVVFRGSGAGNTVWKSSTADTAALSITATSLSVPIRVEGIRFDGSTRTANGIYVGNGNISSGVYIENCDFYQCKLGVHTAAAIDTTAIGCRFWQCYHDVYVESNASSHGGCWLVQDCRSYQNQAAAIVLDGDTGSLGPGQVIVRDSIIESGLGFALFADSTWLNRVVVFDNVWLEANGSAASVTIDGDDYSDPDNFYLNSANVLFRNMEMRGGLLNANAVLHTENVGLYSSVWTVSKTTAASCVVEHHRPQITSSSYTPVPDLCYRARMIPAAENKACWRGPVNSKANWTLTNLLANGSCAVEFSRISDNSNTVSFVTTDTPMGWSKCMKINFAGTAQTQANGVDAWSDVATTDGKFYLFSVDVKSAADMNVSVMFVGTGYATYIANMPTSTDWRRYYCLLEGKYTAAITGMKIFNSGSVDDDAYFSAAQLVEFDNVQDAYALIDSEAVVVGSEIGPPEMYDLSRVYSISADVTDVNDHGTTIFNSASAGITGALAAGTYTGQRVKFVCKVAGNNIDITVANHVTSDPEVIRLDTANEWVELVWDGTDWVEVSGNGQTYP